MLLYTHSILAMQMGAICEHEKRKMNTYCPTPANGPPGIDSLRNWPLGGENALFIMLAQPHYVYGYREPHIKISICANGHTIPSGLLCPLNRPIVQLESDDQSVFVYNLIIFVMLTVQKDFVPLPFEARPINMRWLLNLKRKTF